MQLIARQFTSGSAALAAYDGITRVLDGLEGDAYAVLLAIDGRDVVVVGVEVGDAYELPDVPESWSAADDFQLTEEVTATLLKRSQHLAGRPSRRPTPDVAYGIPRRLNDDGSLERPPLTTGDRRAVAVTRPGSAARGVRAPGGTVSRRRSPATWRYAR